MDAAKQYLKDQGWIPRISFQKTPKVTVKLISDEKRKITDDAGREIEGIAIKVEEDGEEKEIFTASMSLIQQISEYEAGDVVVIEMKKNKTDKGYRTYFKVSEAGKEEGSEEIPIIEEEEEYIASMDIPF